MNYSEKMKKIGLSILAFLGLTVTINAQIDAGSLMGLPSATTAEMNAITSPAMGGCLFNTDDGTIYYYTGSNWQRATDDQNASEINLVTAIDLDEGGASSPTNETTVEEAIQAIAPITSRAGRVFYPPSIAIDASSNVTNAQINLYNQYVNQFASASMVYNPSAPNAIPTYAANELNYYVTYYDPAVFANITITDAGLMEYDIIGQPADYNSLINVVFVVK
ncbi:MAG: hypothetical protein AAGB24_15090 [Bacteroidota bacterium]